jgi:hypothetical protein
MLIISQFPSGNKRVKLAEIVKKHFSDSLINLKACYALLITQVIF